MKKSILVNLEDLNFPGRLPIEIDLDISLDIHSSGGAAFELCVFALEDKMEGADPDVFNVDLEKTLMDINHIDGENFWHYVDLLKRVHHNLTKNVCPGCGDKKHAKSELCSACKNKK